MNETSLERRPELTLPGHARAVRPPREWSGLVLVAPALGVVALFFIVPLVLSAVLAFRGAGGGFTWEHMAKAFDLYTKDLLFTLAMTLLATAGIAAVAIAIAS